MKNLYFFLIFTFISGVCAAQLTVTGFANNQTVCSGNSTLITATASPVGYSVSTIPTAALGSYYTNVLADALSSYFKVTAYREGKQKTAEFESGFLIKDYKY